MDTTFFQHSKTITDKFLQNILFVDDEIFTNKENKNHQLDASQLISIFSKAKKLCALNNPQCEEDFEDVIEVAKKSDVTVLDWKMDLVQSDDTTIDEEADVEEDDPRGNFTLRLIKEILSDKELSGTFKLIVIYTGEIILPEIVEKLSSSLQDFGLQKISDKSVGAKNIKIIVAGKPSLHDQLKHVEELKAWIVDYPQIPEFILNEFTTMTQGLISNFALESLSIIRNNTFRVLQLFNKDLDTAYLGHKILLPKQEDSEDLLVELMKDSLGDLLHYSEVSETINQDIINQWLSEKVISKTIAFLDKKQNLFKDQNGKELDLKYALTNKLFNNLIFEEIADVNKRFDKAFKQTDGFKNLDKVQKAEFLQTIQINSSSLFCVEADKYEELDLKFANLTHHKSLFKPNRKSPKLSLGVVLKGTIHTDMYWVCIQQKCDSVRLKKGETRKFLFLPLIPVDKGAANGFHFTAPNGQRLKLNTKTYNIRTIKFQDTEGHGVIIAEQIEDKYIFKQFYSDKHENFNPEIDENFEWVFDLKDLHAQRISNDIARELSRVGLDESEWLRRWSTK